MPGMPSERGVREWSSASLSAVTSTSAPSAERRRPASGRPSADARPDRSPPAARSRAGTARRSAPRRAGPTSAERPRRPIRRPASCVPSDSTTPVSRPARRARRSACRSTVHRPAASAAPLRRSPPAAARRCQGRTHSGDSRLAPPRPTATGADARTTPAYPSSVAENSRDAVERAASCSARSPRAGRAGRAVAIATAVDGRGQEAAGDHRVARVRQTVTRRRPARPARWS